MAMTRSYKVGDELPKLTKNMTQEAINAFENSGGAKGPSQFTDTETAQKTLGTHGTVASGDPKECSVMRRSELARFV